MSKMRRPVAGINNAPESHRSNTKRAKRSLKKLPVNKFKQVVSYVADSGKIVKFEREAETAERLKNNESVVRDRHPDKILTFGEITEINY